MDEGLREPRDVQSAEPEDGGSRVTLECGHRIWVALPPDCLGSKMYCGWCLDRLIEQLRQRRGAA